MQNYKYEYDYMPCEILDGKIVNMSPSPSPNHNSVTGNIFWIFRTYLKGKRCSVFGENVDVYFDEQNKEIKPDVKIVCNPEKINFKGIRGAPDLIVEVLSPSTAKYDRGYKMTLYAKYGVKEYWIVSPQERFIEVYLLNGSIFELDNMYQIFPDYEIEKMTDKERNAIATEFKTSIFDDLIISVDDVFDKLI